MDVPGLGSLSAVFRAAQSRGLALWQGAALAAKPPLPQLRHGQGRLERTRGLSAASQAQEGDQNQEQSLGHKECL